MLTDATASLVELEIVAPSEAIPTLWLAAGVAIDVLLVASVTELPLLALVCDSDRDDETVACSNVDAFSTLGATFIVEIVRLDDSMMIPSDVLASPVAVASVRSCISVVTLAVSLVLNELAFTGVVAERLIVVLESSAEISESLSDWLSVAVSIADPVLADVRLSLVDGIIFPSLEAELSEIDVSDVIEDVDRAPLVVAALVPLDASEALIELLNSGSSVAEVSCADMRTLPTD